MKSVKRIHEEAHVSSPSKKAVIQPYKFRQTSKGHVASGLGGGPIDFFEIQAGNTLIFSGRATLPDEWEESKRQLMLEWITQSQSFRVSQANHHTLLEIAKEMDYAMLTYVVHLFLRNSNVSAEESMEYLVSSYEFNLDEAAKAHLKNVCKHPQAFIDSQWLKMMQLGEKAALALRCIASTKTTSTKEPKE